MRENLLCSLPVVRTITLIPGDGIGPEVTNAARRILDETGVKFDWEVHDAGAAVAEKRGTTLPPTRCSSRSGETKSR